jgi:hypothetical protein
MERWALRSREKTAMDHRDPAPLLELLKTFEAPIAATPERPEPRGAEAALPADVLLSVAEEAYRALDA